MVYIERKKRPTFAVDNVVRKCLRASGPEKPFGGPPFRHPSGGKFLTCYFNDLRMLLLDTSRGIGITRFAWPECA